MEKNSLAAPAECKSGERLRLDIPPQQAELVEREFQSFIVLRRERVTADVGRGEE